MLEYQKRLLLLEEFIKKNPTSKKKPDAEKMLKELKDESEQVKRGSQKLDGVWITAEALTQNGYLIKAKMLRKKFEAARGKAAYDLFIELENTYPASEDYVTAIGALPNVFTAIQNELEEAMKSSIESKKTRDEVLKGTNVEEKALVAKAIAELRAKNLDEQKRRVIINTYDTSEARTVQQAITGLKRERERITKLDLARLTAVNKGFTQGLKDLSQKAYLSAVKALEPAAALHNRDLAVKALLAEAKKGAASKPAATTPAAAPEAPKAATPVK